MYYIWLICYCEEYTVFGCYVPLNFDYSEMQDVSLLICGSCRGPVHCSDLRSRGEKQTKMCACYRVGIIVLE